MAIVGTYLVQLFSFRVRSGRALRHRHLSFILSKVFLPVSHGARFEYQFVFATMRELLWLHFAELVAVKALVGEGSSILELIEYAHHFA